MLRICKSTYQSLTADQLKGIPVTPRGTRSERWLGVQHFDLVHAIRETLQRLFDFRPLPESERYYVSPNGAILIGGFDLADAEYKPVLMSEADWGQPVGASIGFAHSNNSDKSLQVVAGGTCFLCENGVAAGETKLKRKHTSGLRLAEWIRDGLQDFWERLKKGFASLAKLHHTMFSARDKDNHLLSLARRHILPWRLLGELDALMENSLKEGHALWVPEDKRDAWPIQLHLSQHICGWDWYNAITHIIKQLPPSQQFHALSGARDLLLPNP